MSGSFEISYEFIQKAAQQPGVRKAVHKKAEQIGRRAQGLADSEKVPMRVSVESGTRPGGRPYSNVVGDNAEQEWGSSKTAKRRILGRAAEGA